MATLSQKWHFARHVPPGKIARRIASRLISRVETLVKPRLEPNADQAPVLRDGFPNPLFAPQKPCASSANDGWHFRFIGVEASAPLENPWSVEPPTASKQLWLMNLHYMDYLDALEPEQGKALMSSWVAHNPPYSRTAQFAPWNSYALSLRIVAWISAFARWNGAVPPVLLVSLAQQLHFLERHLELDIGGNHLIKNIKALLIGSAFFSGGRASQWRTKGLALLGKELDAQILPDGMHFERSVSYHSQVFGDLLEIRHALGPNQLAGKLDDCLRKMAPIVGALVHGDGGPALFGDSGLNMARAPGELLAAYADIIGETIVSAGSFAFANAGYFGTHQATYRLIADLGVVGPDALIAHAHGDIGSFELSIGTRRMIVDQGVFEYVEGPKRSASRSSHMHNTLAIAGLDQADFFGSFRCGKRPDVSVTGHVETPDGLTVEGSHNGFAPTMATRRFEAVRDSVKIVDRLEGGFAKSARIGFLLHPQCTHSINATVATIRNGDAIVVMVADLPWVAEPAVYWPDMGTELTTSRLVLALPPSCLHNQVTLKIIDPK